MANPQDTGTFDRWITQRIYFRVGPPTTNFGTTGQFNSFITQRQHFPDYVEKLVVKLDGSITPSGALTKKVEKPLAGSITPAGALVNKIEKPLAGSITPTGSLTIQVNKVLAGSITPAGALLTQSITIVDEARPTKNLMYIEQIKFTEPYGLQLTGGDDQRLSILLAQRELTKDELKSEFHSRDRDIIIDDDKDIRRKGSGGIFDRFDTIYPPRGEVPVQGVIFWPCDAGDIPEYWGVFAAGQGKFLVGADGGTFVGCGVGGAETIDISHTHGPGTLATDSDNHSHGSGTLDTDNDAHTHGPGTLDTDNDSHSHTADGTLAAASDSHSHTAGTLAGDSDSHSHTADGTLAAASDSHSHTADGTLAAASDSHTHTAGPLGSGGPSSTFNVEIHTTTPVVAPTSTHNHTIAQFTTNSDAHTHDVTGSTASDAHTHDVTGSTASAAHTHTISGSAASDAHTHDVTGSTNSDSHDHAVNAGATASDSHDHAVNAGTTASDSHSHTVDSGVTDTYLNATQSILPPYLVGTWIQRLT